MSQRTNRCAFYDKGRWKRREQAKNLPGHRKTKIRRKRKPGTGTDHLPKPRYMGWTAEMWLDAHYVRWNQEHTTACPCLQSPLKLWKRLAASGLYR